MGQDDFVSTETIKTSVAYYVMTTCGDCDWYSGDGDTEEARERVKLESTARRPDCLDKVKAFNLENPNDPANGVAYWDHEGHCFAIRGYTGRGNNEFGIPGVNQWFTCEIKEPELAVGDMYELSAVQGAANKVLPTLESTTQSMSTQSLAVYFFAVVGFGYIAYGAGQHYFATKRENYESIA